MCVYFIHHKDSLMLKKIFILFSILASVAFAGISTQSISNALQSNPSLLNSPQIQAAMRAEGLSKTEILQKINNSNVDTRETNSSNTNLKNNIDMSYIGNNGTKVSHAENNNSLDNNIQENPLLYKENLTILNDIKTKQNIVEKSKLKRFSQSFFANKNTLNISSMPVPDYYIINKGDTVSIWIYGGVNKNINALVDNYGNINIENFGPINVAGLQFKKARKIITSELSHAFGGANVAVNISSYSTIQVILTGSVKAPGIYNIPSLSTVKDLLVVSNGIKQNGSVRDIVIKRAGKTLKHIDLYGLLTGKKENTPTILRNGDTVFVPKATKIAGIDGAVYTKALFELKKGETLYDLISYAGGLKANASKYGIKLKRYSNNKNIISKTVDYKNSRQQIIKNGDNVYVYTIDSVHKKNVYLYGNVVRPGNRGYERNLTLYKLLNSEIQNVGLKGLFLDSTLFSYAIIKRKSSDLSTKIISFNLSKAISGKKRIKLMPDDEIYVFNKLDSQVNPYVSIYGNTLIKSGKYQYYKGLKVSDLIEIAGLKSPYDTSRIKVISYDTENFMPKINIISAKEAKSYNLSPFSEVYLFDYYSVNHIPTARVKGEINFQGVYKIDNDTTLSKLIQSAGGLTQKAYDKRCEIIRYYIENGKRKKKSINISLKDAKNFKIKNFDEVTIFKIPNWNDRMTVELKGEVRFPGTYVVESGDKLADVIRRAGGFTKKAFLYGSVFTRESIKKLQKQKLQQSLVRLKQKSVILGNSPRGAGEGKNVNSTEVANMIASLSKEAQNLEPIGRITVSLKRDLNKFQNSMSNLTLEDGDKLYVPSFNDTVLVVGEVMSPTAIIYQSEDIMDYLEKSGGLTDLADGSSIYIVHANGEAKKYKTGLFASSISVKKGDVIVVPQKLVTTTGMQFTKDVAGILYQFAVTAASLKTVGAL